MMNTNKSQPKNIQSNRFFSQQISAIEASGICISIVQNDVYLFVNKPLLNLLGYEYPDELVGQNWRVMYALSEIERIERDIFPKLEHECFWRGELMSMRKDGSTFAQNVSIALDKSGVITYISHNSSDYESSGKVLQAKEARATAALEQATVGFAETDMQTGQFTFINQCFCSMLGYTQAELMEMTVVDITLPEDMSLSKDYIAKLYSGQIDNFSQEKRYLCKDGSSFRAETTVYVVKPGEGQATRCLALIKDIRKRKQAEVILQKLILGTTNTTGSDFFTTLVTHIAEALNVSYAIVTEMVGDTLQTKAFWANGDLQPTYSYKLAQTPCEQVFQNGEYYCECSVQFFFPNDIVLVELEAESYFGIVLNNTQGKPIGHLYIMHTDRIQDIKLAEYILRAFAARAAAELERQRAMADLALLNQKLEVKVEERSQALINTQKEVDLERQKSNVLLKQLNQELEAKVEQRTSQLKEREQFLQTVLDTSPLSIFWKDLDSMYLGCNNKFLSFAGLTNPKDIVGKTDYDLPWTDSETEAYRKDDQHVMDSDTAKLGIIETQFTANGEQIWLETHKLPLHNLEGEVIGVLGTYQEITARVQAQQDLQQLNEELEAKVEERTKALNMTQAAVNLAADTVFLIRPCGQFHYVNDTACSQLGYSREELLTMSVYDLDANLTADDWPKLWQKVKLKSTMALEAMMQPKAGSAYPVEFNTRYLELDGEAYNVAFVRDITERKLADATIRRQNAFRKKILENMAEGLFVCYQIGEAPFIHFTVWNQQMQTLTGYTLAEINQLGFGMHPDPDDQVRAMNRLNQMHQGINITGEEWEIQRKDGNRRTIALAASVLFDSNGQSSLLALVQDITERKQAELELQRTNEELVRATHLKDEFLANMSHELRTPLNAILGMTEGLQDNVFGQLHFLQLQPLKIIETSATHLLELINDILDVATIEAGQITLELSSTSIPTICQSSLAFIKQQAYKKCLQIEVKIPPNLSTVSLDERRIRQVLINLLSNAVKFTPPGGKITLEVNLHRQSRSSHPPVVENDKQEGLLQSVSRQTSKEIDSLGLEDCVKKKDHLIIAVSDTGIGIAPEHMQYLFQPFVQVDSSLNRKYEGTGLGLSLVKRIVELHGGYVDVMSEVDIGSCFTVTLPCVVEISSLDKQTTKNDIDGEDKWNSQTISPLILLAEDNEANSITISSYLQSKGYRIKLATNGYQALELAQSDPPDLILMDIQMPEMDGLETMQLIRKDSRLASVPIIALTAFTMEGDRERCCEAGANEYISKPVQPKKLVHAIQLLLDVVDNSAPSFP